MRLLKTFKESINENDLDIKNKFDTFFYRFDVTETSSGKPLNAEKYIKNGDDVNLTYENESLLSIALSNNETDIVKMLIDAGADVNFDNGHTFLLFYPVDYMNYEITKLLIDNGSEVKNDIVYTDDDYELNILENAISRTSTNDDFKIVALLIENGAKLRDVSLDLIYEISGKTNWIEKLSKFQNDYNIRNFLMKIKTKEFNL